MSSVLLEIEYASMLAHGATPAEAAERIGLPEQVVACTLRKLCVKRLVKRYTKDAGLAGVDTLRIASAHAARRT